MTEYQDLKDYNAYLVKELQKCQEYQELNLNEDFKQTKDNDRFNNISQISINPEFFKIFNKTILWLFISIISNTGTEIFSVSFLKEDFNNHSEKIKQEFVAETSNILEKVESVEEEKIASEISQYQFLNELKILQEDIKDIKANISNSSNINELKDLNY